MQASDHAFLRQPVIVWFALDQMPDTFEFRVRSELVQLTAGISALQINPAYDPGNEWMFIGQTQQPASLLNAVTRLHQNRMAPTVPLQNRLKRLRQVVVTEHIDLRCHPRIIKAPDLPEMLM